ncbi:hypothetical protein [Cryobacterium cryoconiti]|uniref:Type II secretion system protein M n=1 Tax=Cryobacterium cryoconiti TaxID=1259239 RepID=A0A4Y8JX52_9MICO|nr:hypothetical protein [Cryobacterium cryoconiti]TFD30539.1 hypothetical protein E3T49_07860 [Cryobacterium cryoconiti]
MDKNRMWMIGSVLVMVLVLVLGVLLGIMPQLSATAAADEQRASVAESNAGQALILAQLKKDFEGIESLKSELIPLDASVPSGTNMPAFVTQLDALAAASQVTLTGITVSDAVPYAPVVAPIPAPVAVAEGADSTSTPTPTPTVAAIEPGAGVPPVTNDQINASNFASLAITVSVTGSYADALNFVSGLQSGERLFLVSGLTTTVKEGDEENATPGGVTATISGLVYVLVPPAAASAAAAG